MPKSILYRAHAETVLRERKLDKAWVEYTVLAPEWTEPDPADPTLERRFRVLPERHGRILRVVCAENHDSIIVVTAFLDRRARRP